MSEIEETKHWIINTVWPEIIKNGKLQKNSKTSQIVNGNNNESFTILDVSLTSIGLDEAFMLTKCHRIKIDYMCNGEKQSIYLISKRTPTTFTAENYEAVNFETLFHNEITAYNKMIPRLMELSNASDSDNNCPIYYYSSIKENEASIVLSDFRQNGFRMSPDQINLSLEHILLGVKLIGGFHGICYAFKTLDRKEFDDLVALTKEARYSKPQPEEWNVLQPVLINRLIKAADNFYPEMPEDFKEKLKLNLTDHFEYSKMRVKPIEPYATICHGDFLRNNIAFAYEDNENPTVPKKAMMFDFQTLRYSSPMVDLTTFLTISTGMEVRVPNFDKIFQTYHQKLCSTFVDLTQKELPEFMSKSNMLKEYVRYLPYSLAIASFFLPNMIEPNNIMSEYMLGDNFNAELLEAGLMALGGEPADKELASLQKELYEFVVKENVDVFEGFL